MTPGVPATSLSIRATRREASSYWYVVTRPLGAVSAATRPASSYVVEASTFQVPSWRALPSQVHQEPDGGAGSEVSSVQLRMVRSTRPGGVVQGPGHGPLGVLHRRDPAGRVVGAVRRGRRAGPGGHDGEGRCPRAVVGDGGDDVRRRVVGSVAVAGRRVLRRGRSRCRCSWRSNSLARPRALISVRVVIPAGSVTAIVRPAASYQVRVVTSSVGSSGFATSLSTTTVARSSGSYVVVGRMPDGLGHA